MKAAGQDVLRPTFRGVVSGTPRKPKKEIVMTNPSISRQISLEEYRSLSAPSLPLTQRKAMFVVNREVYDATTYLDQHPGGAVPIWAEVGKPSTAEGFLDLHSDEAKMKLVPVSPSYLDSPLKLHY